MSPIEILFIIIAAATLGSALMVVLSHNLIHSALWLIMSLFGVAIFYVFLNAGFLAVVQVIVYIGAIAILMIFAIMLTRKITNKQYKRFNQNWFWAFIIAITMFGAVVWIFNGWPGINTKPVAIPVTFDPLVELGQALVSPEAFILPFELASVLLLAALIGAIVIAWERK